MSQSTQVGTPVEPVEPLSPSLPTRKNFIPHKLRQLLSTHSRNGRIEKNPKVDTAWNLDYRNPVQANDAYKSSDDDDCSIASNGSLITIESESMDNNLVEPLK
jgi:hypothetical protein